MSTSTLGIGVPVPRLLPLTGAVALPFAAYFSLLAHRVVFNRLDNKCWIGEESSTSKATSTSEPSLSSTPLKINSRCFNNFVESVPLALLVGAVAELNGANRKILGWAYAGLFVARILHAEVGLRHGDQAMGLGRPIGFWSTQGFILGVAGWSAYLSKGWWGY